MKEFSDELKAVMSLCLMMITITMCLLALYLIPRLFI